MSRRDTAAQFLLFLGPILFAGGFLAIWRTGQRSIFYAMLALFGLILWLVGLALRWREEP